MKAIFIVGPTAVGKTDLAFGISKVIPSILISADSVQAYRGADIISGKDKSVKTYLLDVAPATQPFSVRDFVENVRHIVKKARLEGRIPIVVGGTGFYIDALFRKIDTLSIPPNQVLREKLEKLTVKKLQEKLKKLSLDRFLKMNKSDVSNKRRLIRAIEIAQSKKRNIKSDESIFNPSEVLIIGLKASMDNLRKRIADRVEKRLAIGAVDEAKELFKEYEHLSPQLKTANGYRQLFEYLKGKLTYNVAKEAWINSEVKTARNQMTWLKKNKNIKWFDIGKRDLESRISKLIEEEFVLGRE
ncbi:MAG: tRNA (adenosine(37)-N6)-dimethylallyltransferase MiaA [Candidatus Levybacteria bacterium RIFCSPHIGHO2_02_FULL_40_18]|nr:MAG: tRNA (adenosine(37)-N6)-dimethylallyltransferase MiaA [Candidatus Levybacteria bacterium RIFCSPHIGHO2_01_FULL_40_58]OGH26426.1 MAG: tRNA (adenosine(37)-N6)-dimethylallyltransferase MiaA [Candidatus Levybacteria bacterium RIFCSPHIGHO2_02_FULL_40_18]OGH31874.1 MAG: tRNA (adenosine(37)-N6)-dimethylallyltransferase MiaA [Candidatus Levybacteria bacterium RIFCSPHIGHO2_12_FULL_40_31]OGH40507.1 MAG: tRNA (adenosine(37)-N6)-dimethylallyltransferase MiaA [Candidatus Levybacteria bacterium RIFCSPL